MYNIPELPELIGTEAQIAYANDIRAGLIRSITDAGAFAEGTPFRERVYQILARYLSPSADEVERIKKYSEKIDAAIQETINAILSTRQAKNVIENSKKKGPIADRVASGAARRMGWTE